MLPEARNQLSDLLLKATIEPFNHKSETLKYQELPYQTQYRWYQVKVQSPIKATTLR
jgi:phage protein U